MPSSSFPHPSLASALSISVQCALCNQCNCDHYRRRSSENHRHPSSVLVPALSFLLATRKGPFSYFLFIINWRLCGAAVAHRRSSVVGRRSSVVGRRRLVLLAAKQGDRVALSPQNETFFGQKGGNLLRQFLIFYKGHIRKFLIFCF
jgi:hypothetical protein